MKADNKPITLDRLIALDTQMAALVSKLYPEIKEADYSLLTTSALTRNLIAHYNKTTSRLLSQLAEDAISNATYIRKQTVDSSKEHVSETKKDVD